MDNIKQRYRHCNNTTNNNYFNCSSTRIVWEIIIITINMCITMNSANSGRDKSTVANAGGRREGLCTRANWASKQCKLCRCVRFPFNWLIVQLYGPKESVLHGSVHSLQLIKPTHARTHTHTHTHTLLGVTRTQTQTCVCVHISLCVCVRVTSECVCLCVCVCVRMFD